MKERDLHMAVHWSDIVRGIGVLLLGLAAIIFVVWIMLDGVTATGFDADGVRCYDRGLRHECIKTVNP